VRVADLTDRCGRARSRARNACLCTSFRISSADEFDDVFAGWAREGYDVGQGRHLTSP